MTEETTVVDEIDYSGLPLGTREGMKAYIETRRQTGGFLYAVLSNDLEMAFTKADEVNTHRMRDYIVFLRNQAPTLCWGSRKKVEDWLDGKDCE